jgi:hypothetical protein
VYAPTPAESAAATAAANDAAFQNFFNSIPDSSVGNPAVGCLALFGDGNSCWGPIGSTTAMVLGTGLVGLLLWLARVKH